MRTIPVHERTRSFCLSALAALLLLFCLACGESRPPAETRSSTEAPSGPSASTDVCALLTAEEIEEVVGTAPGAPEALTEGLGGCTWPSPGDAKPLVQLSITPTSLKSYDDFVADYGREFGGENPSKEYYRPHEGVGDWGLYRKDDHVLQVFVGDRVLEIIADEEHALALAAKALNRYP